MKKLILIAVLACFSISTFGQEKEKKFEKIREAKIEFIKQRLALTEGEEKKFLPVYNKFLDESDALRNSSKTNTNLSEVDLTFMTDEECEKLIKDITEQKQKEVELIKKYTNEFKKVLPIKKVAMIFKVEHEFKKVLVRKLRRHKAKELREKSKAMREEMLKKREELRKQSKKLREEHRKQREQMKKEMEKMKEQIEKEVEKIKKESDKLKEEHNNELK
jgi:hypothetical protein